jgi:hypothetical protein
MTDYVRKNADNLLNPTQVFIMLEQCDAVDYCHEEEIIELYGDETKLKEAFAPSEIIYENRSYSNAGRGVKAFIILIFLAIIFIITAYITGFIRDLVFQLDSKYQTVDECGEIMSGFGVDIVEKRVADEWFYYYEGADHGKTKQKISALMTCFCGQ